MKVYVALLQPDGDWDHLATLLGVFSTSKQAAEVLAPYRSHDPHLARLVECVVDKKRDPAGYA